MYGDQTKDFYPISKLSLLYTNTIESRPFADRLVEYLSGHAITPLDNITLNVARVQDKLYNGGLKGLYDIFDSNIQLAVRNRLTEKDLSKRIEAKIIDQNDNQLGANSSSEIIYLRPRYVDEYFDLLTYVDKDVESLINR